jgi:tetratricopeptide (TPR) repeat protein
MIALALGACALLAVAAVIALSLGDSGTGGGADRGSHQVGPGGAGASRGGTASSGGGRANESGSQGAVSVPAGADGAQLNDEGYALIQQGRYADAIPILRRAVASFPAGTTDLTYAYALFNLGHALRMAGHPEAAIPILERRLRIPDQTTTVQEELDAARAAAGG